MSAGEVVELGQDPLANPPRPSSGMLTGARMATLKSEAISDEARHLQRWLAVLVEEHELWAKLRKRARKEGPRANFERALGAFIADLLGAVGDPRQNGLVYRSRRSNTFSKTAHTYDGFKTAVDAMQERDLIEVFDGFKNDWSIEGDDGREITIANRKAARYRATPTLILLAKGLGIDPEDLAAHFYIPPPERVLSLKSGSRWRGGTKVSGTALALPETEEVEALSSRVRTINDFLSGVDIQGGHHARFFRGFDKGDAPDFAWNKGGRLYSEGGRSYQQLPSGQRLQMTLDGEVVVEIDVKASFLTILHGLTGTPLDMGDDAYAFAGATREIAKGWLTASLGSGKPLSRWPKQMAEDYQTATSKELGIQYRVREVGAAMMIKFPILRDLANLKLGWAELMFVESEAIIGAMEDLQALGVPSLPVHDSLIVPASAEAAAIAIIKARYQRHAGIEPKLTVTHG